MITEDYVSFETAKLLKEKGFDVYGDGSFGSSIKIWMEYSPFGKIRDISTATPSVKAYPAPTLQMAMKWLREVYHIFLSIQQHMDMSYVWYAYVDGAAKGCDRESHNNTYEEACEEAIKYCLEKLI